MSTPTFAKTHNLIVYMEKPTESEGFEQIIDFLNRSSASYALKASPTIRTSCIHQFWTTAKVKTINDEVRIQALIDEKRVNIKESSIHHTLKLDDAEGTSCLANTEIFDGLAKMGYEKLSEKLTFYKAFFSPQWKFLIHTILQCLSAKTTSWNEFSNTMASVIICLATNQKFNFSRYILLSIVKNIEVGVPFFMFPRFAQLLIDHQLGDMSHHKDIYANPSLTKKVFANMKRVGAGFSRVVTTLFDTMLVPATEEVVTTAEAPKVGVPRRRRGVIIQDHEETTSTVVMNSKNVVMEQVTRSEKKNDAVMKYQALKRKPLTEAQARKNMIICLKNMAGFKMNYFKGMTYSEIRPLFEKHFNYNQVFLEKVNKEVILPEKEVEVEAHKREGESLEKEVTKKQRMDKEAEDLKSHL
nr:hypothetical protein [Tanacetum cinerariifolium]